MTTVKPSLAKPDRGRLEVFSSAYEAPEMWLYYVYAGLGNHNSRHFKKYSHFPVNIFIREDRGPDALGDLIRAGLLGRVEGRTLMIDVLWVEDRFRGEGLGHKLMDEAEKMARTNECKVATVGTYGDFGAREFYEKCGYKLVSTSQDPEEHTVYVLAKNL